MGETRQYFVNEFHRASQFRGRRSVMVPELEEGFSILDDARLS